MSALENRVALVTGASRGIGRAVALELAKRGAHVIAVARTQGALEELDDAIRGLGGSATLVPCDLKDFDAIDRLGLAVFERWKKLDILVGNAGLLGPTTPLPHLDPPQWNDVMAVNVTANYRLIRSFDALLRQSDAGRAVFISSGAGNKADLSPYRGPYAISKAALDAMARTWAAETQNTSKVKVMLVNPGYVRTKMRAQLMPGEDPMSIAAPEDIAPKIVDLCMPAWTETGRILDIPMGTVHRFREPA
ncbi:MULTISPECIES: SDR family NAD(P)-dependent oxidoreductase [unclassified Beijerinckia]|uniref:SDR family NAD(P)-dependent oxidoreductase n=1 Tax=unclassified Beijerinckia TaxID=2638183 RepID=UPI00089C7AE2|nr:MULTISPECIES: SDR family NAD(P)-dependent oxidoreductase [unclassified Beijerinckia]MDH7795750.1 NAD(P)-dependent dehydrogenase (short-subunit alcohol dehydrogenase family) [Beijerinckia sp. GAS462]SEC14596.1 NAD(P)-dependent dehydrogenase, short-chain alcohol dehydrogenase family [Beijerinckia sp. 28-YEA-48]